MTAEVRIGAHRGAMCYEPENTLAAFEKAVELGTWRIELDVRRSRDGALVLMHDQTVDRTTDGTGGMSELDYATLRSLRCGGSEPIPTLSETLEFARSRVRLLVEIKDSAAVDDVVLAIRTAGMWEACTISCFDEAVLLRVKELEPRIETAYFHLKPGPLDVPAMVRRLGVKLLIVWPAAADADQFAAAKSAGLDIRSGFPDNITYDETAEQGRRLIALGADELSCGRPDWIARIIAET